MMKEKSSKVLVTGATGYIGNQVVSYLLQQGDFNIIASSADRDKAKSCQWFDKVEYIQADLSKEKDNYFRLFGEPDLLIHLAWKGLPDYKSFHHFNENLFNDFRFISNIITHGLKNITITGTCMEYGMQEGCLSESLPPLPDTPYGIAKNSLRGMVEQLQKTKSFSFKWLRLFYTYGPGQNQNSLFSQLERALQNNEKVFNMSGGEQKRDFLPVAKMAEYIVKAALQDKEQGIINCCSGKGTRVIDLVNHYLQQNNSKIELNLGHYPYPDYEPFAFWGDNRKLNTILNA